MMVMVMLMTGMVGMLTTAIMIRWMVTRMVRTVPVRSEQRVITK